jgi:hypothetical protein
MFFTAIVLSGIARASTLPGGLMPNTVQFKHFQCWDVPWVKARVPDLLDEIGSNDELWLADTSRQRKIKVQQHTQSIFLRGAVRAPGSPASSNDIQESAPARYASRFPATIKLLNQIAEHFQADLCRALYVRLLPFSEVLPHVDGGSYYLTRDRYHLVIYSVDGSVMSCEDEQVVMYPGELWSFNNKLQHESKNASPEWRVHLIFDLLPKAAATATS